MKLLIFLCALIGNSVVFASQSSTENKLVRIYENEVNETLECIRELLQEGVPEHNIPSFAPLVISNLSIDLTSLGIEGTSGYINMRNLVIDGLLDWILYELEINANVIGGLGGTVIAKLDMPALYIKTDYDGDVTVAGMNIWGDGDITIDIGHLGIQLDTKVLLTRISLDHIKILPSLETFHIVWTGLFNDEDESALVSQILNELVVDWVNEKAEDISTVLEQLIMELVNGSKIQTKAEGEGIIQIILDYCPLFGDKRKHLN